jgi:hypothetical protein
MYMLNDSEKITALVEAAVMVLRDFGAVDAESVSQVLKGYAPEIWHRFGAQYVESLAQRTFQSEDREASLRFTEFFEIFNGKYFDDQLPPYQVRAVFLLENWIAREFVRGPEIGAIDLESRCIYVCLQENCEEVYSSDMVDSLLRLMARAAIGPQQNDEALTRELRRLRGLGAPILQLN